MQKQLKITYHYNSGFSIRIGSTLLVFDYWEGEGRKLDRGARITRDALSVYEQVFVFVSHAHPDHFDEIIYDWREDMSVVYIVPGDMPVGKRGRRISPGEEMELSTNVSVKAFGSTDLGVSFLVTAYGARIFHAGDLNLWHWRQESTLREIESAEAAFYDCLAPIPACEIDVCMFPVDPRQGLMYDAGANHFILTKKPRVFIPMHWQERPEVAMDYARRSKTAQTETIALAHPGEVAEITMDETELVIHIIEPPKDARDLPPAPLRRRRRQEAMSGDDPFADSDLPIDLNE